MEQAYKLSKIENNKPFWNIKIINHNGSYVFLLGKRKLLSFGNFMRIIPLTSK